MASGRERLPSQPIATARGKGNGAKADVEKARDAALSTANQAHAQAGETLGQLDAALGDADDQMVKLKEKDSEDSHDEILDRETAWEEYRTELLAAPEEAEQDLAAALDKLQLGLDVAGLIPGPGNLCDLANAAISLYRERYFEAGLSVAAVVPIYGQSATAAKLGRRGFKYADEALQYGDNALRWVDNVAPNSTVRNFDVVNYRPTTSPFENHHGILDVWAKHNISNYVSRGAKTPTLALTKAQHAATKRVYRDWLFEQTGRRVGGRVDWTKVSPQEMQSLTNRTFDAADVPEAARREYFSAFHRYIYGG